MNARALFIIALVASLLAITACDQEEASELSAPEIAEPTTDEADDPAESDAPTLELITLDGNPQVRCHLSGTLEEPTGLDCTPDDGDLSERLLLAVDSLQRDSTTAILQTHGDGLLLDDNQLEDVTTLSTALRDHAEQQAEELLIIVDGDRSFRVLLDIMMNLGPLDEQHAITVVPRLQNDITEVEVPVADGEASIRVWSPSATYPLPAAREGVAKLQVTVSEDDVYVDREQLESLDALSEHAAAFLEEDPEAIVLIASNATIQRVDEVLQALRHHDGEELFTAFGYFVTQ